MALSFGVILSELSDLYSEPKDLKRQRIVSNV